MAEWLNTPLIVIAVLAVVSAIGGLIWKVATWKTKVDDDRSIFKSTLESFMKEIRDDIKTILGRMDPAVASRASPLSLNKLGKSIAEEMGTYQWATNLAPTLLDKVKGMEPFQIDEFCDQYVYSELTDHWQGVVAATAYSKGLTRGDVRTVFHITLRDELLRLTGNN